MKTFYQKVNMRSRKAMTDFLSGHFRYDTMNSCNNSTSYAHNVKINRCSFTNKQQDVLYGLMQTDEFYENLNEILHEFDEKYNYRWQAGFNGRSGGYIVLYQGGIENRKPYTHPCMSTDQNEGFDSDEWTMHDLRERVKLVQDFDRMCDDVLASATYMADNYEAEEEEILVPKKVLVMREVA